MPHGRAPFPDSVVKQPAEQLANAPPPLFFATRGRRSLFPSPLNEGMERREAPGSLRGSPTGLTRARLIAPTAISPLPGIRRLRGARGQ